MNEYTSKAWLLEGVIHSCPGVLRLADGQLRYLIAEPGTFSDKAIRALLQKHGVAIEDELSYPIQLFAVDIADVTRFHIPWYYFGAGGKLALGQMNLRFSFVRPENTVEPTYFSEDMMKWMGGAGQKEVNLVEGRRAGKAWKELLTAPNKQG